MRKRDAVAHVCAQHGVSQPSACEGLSVEPAQTHAETAGVVDLTMAVHS